METKLTSRTENQAQLTISLNEAKLKPIVAHVLNDLRPRVKAAGFRPGKAPDHIVERDLGSALVQNEVLEHAVQESYSEAVKAENLPIVAPPQVQIDKFVPYTELEYKVTVELMPKFTLPKYQDIRIKRPVIAVDPAEVEQTITDLRRREAVRLDTDRAIEADDEVVFDFDGTKDGQPVRGASAKDQTLVIGSGLFIPGFEDELIGMKKGDEKSFDIRFPDEYHESTLAGQVVTFKVKINSVKELILPAVDSVLADKVGGFKSVDAMKADIADRLSSEKAEAATRDYEQQVLAKLLEETKFSIPESLLDQQLRRLRAELEQNLAYSGLDLPKYLEMSKKTEDELTEELKPEAERRVGLAMILTEVASAENITLSAKELDDEIERMKVQYKDEATRAELDRPETREEVYNHLMASRVIGKLVSFAEQSE
ncbi:trigger factor [Candidatus Saccharibacteria bacterium]|nr:trigger factor [Candidatus Saccharibacteria bacterium]